jgi:serine/threonine-protein kinase
VLLLAAGGAVGALKVLAAGKKSVDIHPVPDLHGRTQQDAAALITADEWNTTVSQEYDDDVPVGTIIRTDPAPLFPLRPAGTLGLVVSQGPKPRLLPELAGKTLEDATATLTALKLTISQAAPAYDENVPAGAVVSWSVPSQPTLIAGGQVLPGTDVQVVLSQGPAPRTVPNLIGQTLEQAHAALDPVGLVIAEAPQEFNNDVLSGGIVRTDPVAGGQLPKGGTVTIVVSKGRDLVTFPSFPATDLATVQQVLADSGFVVASVTGNSAGSLYQAMVNGKAVQAGQTFDRGTAVDLIFL